MGIVGVVHGFGMYSELYVDDVKELVGDDWRVVPLNLPGHGPLRTRFSQQSVEEFVPRAAETLLSSDGESGVLLIAESMGCCVLGPLSRALRRQGGRVKGAVLLSPPFELAPETLVRWLASGFRPSRAAGLLLNRIPIDAQMGSLIGNADDRARILRDSLVKTEVSWSYIKASAELIWRLPDSLRALGGPAVLVQGTADPLLGRRNIAKAQELCSPSACDSIVVEGASHCLFWDPHRQQFMAELKKWLSQSLRAT